MKLHPSVEELRASAWAAIAQEAKTQTLDEIEKDGWKCVVTLQNEYQLGSQPTAQHWAHRKVQQGIFEKQTVSCRTASGVRKLQFFRPKV